MRPLVPFLAAVLALSGVPRSFAACPPGTPAGTICNQDASAVAPVQTGKTETEGTILPGSGTDDKKVLPLGFGLSPDEQKRANALVSASQGDSSGLKGTQGLIGGVIGATPTDPKTGFSGATGQTVSGALHNLKSGISGIIPPKTGSGASLDLPKALDASALVAEPKLAEPTKLLATNPAEALTGYNAILASSPDDPGALTGQMLAARATGDYKVTLQAARRLQALDPNDKAAAAVIQQVENQQRASGTLDRFKKFSDGFKPEAQDAGDLQAAQGAMGSGAGRTAGAPKAALPPDPTAGLTEGFVPAPRPAAPAGAAAAGGPAAAGAPAGTAWTPTVRGLSADRYQFAPLVLKAINKKGMGDYTGALLDLTQELDGDPRDLPAWILRSEVDSALQNFPAGVSDAGKALEIAPENARALRARAFAELGAGDAAAAYADALKATGLDPQNGLGFLYLAMAEERTGRSADAIRHLRRAVELDPALEPMSRPLAQTLGVASAPAGSSTKRSLLRGGFIAASLALTLFGLLGTKAGRDLTRSWTTRGRAAGAAPEAPRELEAGTLLGGTYRIVRELGRGGMGVVYEGHDLTLDRRVAIKRLLADGGTTPEDLDRFLREARLVAALKHPNLAHIYTVLPGEEPFLVFEFVDGKPLDQVLREDRTLPVPAARRIVRELASALGAAHAASIIHRDLKPGNVMIAADGTAKVMDFGIAHRSHAAATRMTQTVASGTPPYMPPEQAMGSVSKASDLYSLGVMAYELLTGVRPFDGPDFLEQKLQRRYEPVTRRVPTLPAGLDAFFARALDPDPTKRPPDAAAFADEFDRACDATPRAAAPAA